LGLRKPSSPRGLRGFKGRCSHWGLRVFEGKPLKGFKGYLKGFSLKGV